MKKRIVWLVPIFYYTSKANARLRFIQGGITKMWKNRRGVDRCDASLRTLNLIMLSEVGIFIASLA